MLELEARAEPSRLMSWASPLLAVALMLAGGVLVFSPDGRRLGRIETGGPVSNVAFGGDGHDLYMTSGSVLARVRVRASGRLPAD